MAKKEKTPGKAVKNLPAVFLAAEQAPFNFREDANWRIFRILAEFVEGFEFLAPLKKEVTFFGSARFLEKNLHYQQARKLARLLGEAGFTVVTGGGPGIMEAANRGAFETNAESVGLNIQLPKEQRINPYVKRGIGFHYFFTRKVMLSVSAQAYVFFPGGFGTLDEFFEIITLLQTKKMENLPVILVGQDYWQPLLGWLRKVVCQEHQAITVEDLSLFTLVDSAESAFEILKNSHERKYL